MDSLTFTINLKDLDACDGDFDQVVSAIQNFINILNGASPDYYLAGDILQKQLDEQVKEHKEEAVDPKEQMQKYLDNSAPDIIDGRVTELNALYCDLRNTIGEAMGPVSYAAYSLATKLKELGQESEWVWDFVKYYEENWEF